MSAKVVNVRHGVHYDVYVGRPSTYGNPFVIGKDGTREQVIARYRRWLEMSPGIVELVKKNLKGKVLGCYCAPLPCHADILVEIANESPHP